MGASSALHNYGFPSWLWHETIEPVMANRGRIALGALAASAMLSVVAPLRAAGAPHVVSGSVPDAVCSQLIYSGTAAKAVVQTPHDVVVGPVRFGDLDPRAVLKIAGSPLLGIKSPMTVGPTPFKALLVSAEGARSPVGVAYGQVPSTTTTSIDLRTVADRVLVQAPVSCGLPASGFAQYGGGLSLAHKECVTLTVSLPGGRVIARKTVPLGTSVSCGNSKA
jgi:hypothetical protein